MRIDIVFKTLLAVALLALLGGVGYTYSGFYDVAASQPDGAATRWLLTVVRDRSIARRSAAIAVPKLDDPKLVHEGFEHYHEMCAGCHLAPGMASSEIRAGLNPQPPVLATVVAGESPARLFWVIKNGVKMTGMPAWGTSHSDQMIWAMVAFLQKLPRMTPAEYQTMEKSLGPAPDADAVQGAP